jgi:hypothetical protein
MNETRLQKTIGYWLKIKEAVFAIGAIILVISSLWFTYKIAPFVEQLQKIANAQEINNKQLENEISSSKIRDTQISDASKERDAVLDTTINKKLDYLTNRVDLVYTLLINK